MPTYGCPEGSLAVDTMPHTFLNAAPDFISLPSRVASHVASEASLSDTLILNLCGSGQETSA